MAITKTNQPYEFLARWNNGTLAGAHIRFLETISEDGVVLSQKEGNAQPVSLAGEAGFPIEDILDGLQATALSDLAAAQAAKATAEAALTAKQAELDTTIAAHTTALAAKDAEIAALEVQVVALTPAPSVPSVVASPRQIRQALTAAGMRAAVEDAVAAGDQDIKDWWNFSTAFERTNLQVTAMATALGVSDEELDGLWALAVTL